jgi:Na+/proline symporter
MAGGLGAAIVTDLIQGILTITFSFLLLPYVFNMIGGWGALQENSGLKGGMLDLVASKQVAEIVGREPITIFYVFMLSLTALAGIVVQPHIMGVCGAGKTEFEGRFGFTFGNFIKRFCTMAWTFTGLACIVWYLGTSSPLQHADKPADVKSTEFKQLSEEDQKEIVEDRQTYSDLKAITHEDFKDLSKAEQDRVKAVDKGFADELFGKAAYTILRDVSPGLIGLLLASLLAAIMSSSDAQMVVSSGLFTENIYKRFLVREKSQKHYLWIGRFSGLIIVIFALVMQATFTDVIDALRTVIKTPAILGISLWCGIVWRGWTPLAVWISAAASAATWGYSAYFPEEIAAWSLSLGEMEFNLHFLMNDGLTKVSDAWQMASFMSVGLVVGFLVSFITPRTPKAKLDHFFRLLRTPVRKGEVVDKPCTLPDNPLPEVEKIFNYEDIELPKPTWVGIGGFVAAWMLVGAIIGLTYYLAQTL